MSIATTVLADGFHAPSMQEFFPPAVLFAGTPFELNRIMLIRILATIVLCTVFLIGARRLRLVPSRGQSLLEMALDFVRVQIAEDTMGKKAAERYLPLITTIFFMVFALNITGIVPFLNIAGTSVVGVPLLLALIVYVSYHWGGIKEFGLFGYLKNALILPGVPLPLQFLMVPIEALTKFVIQPFTLTLRLLCNMLVGHLLLVLCFSATWFFFFDAALGFKFFGIITIAGGMFVTLLEILIAVLQAYVFALLAAVYISQSISKEH